MSYHKEVRVQPANLLLLFEWEQRSSLLASTSKPTIDVAGNGIAFGNNGDGDHLLAMEGTIVLAVVGPSLDENDRVVGIGVHMVLELVISTVVVVPGEAAVFNCTLYV